jgi:hypothetical protein
VDKRLQELTTRVPPGYRGDADAVRTNFLSPARNSSSRPTLTLASSLTLRSTSAVEAENLFLQRQLALYVERGLKPRRIDSNTRIALTILSVPAELQALIRRIANEKPLAGRAAHRQ